MLTTAALAFVVNIGATVFKYLYSKIGTAGTQAVVFGLAVLAALYYQYSAQVPGLVELVKATLVIFSSSVAIYEVILSRFDFFKSPA